VAVSTEAVKRGLCFFNLTNRLCCVKLFSCKFERKQAFILALMIKSRGQGSNPNSLKALEPVKPTGKVPVSVTLRLLPSEAEKLQKLKNRSASLSRFLSQNLDDFLAFEKQWASQPED
jgi:hypothetical protein